MATKILIVDDDLVTRKGLTELLKEFGYEAMALDSGEKALKAAREDDFDLALVDLKMPKMDGIEVLEALKSIKPRMYIVMITAYATVETAVEAMKAGAFDYIRKPFKADELNSVILRILEEDRFEKTLSGYELTDFKRSSVQVFREMVKTRKGLCLTSENPKSFAKKNRIKDVPLYHVTSDGNGKYAISPKNLNAIKKLTVSFTRKNRGSAVLIHGLEPLLRSNSLSKVKEFLTNLKEDIASMDSMLMVSARPESLDDQTLLELENAFSGDYTQNMSESLANHIRRAVIRYLSIAKKASFTDIMRNVGEHDSPKLSFHLRKLVSFEVIAKDGKGQYHLSPRGKKLVAIIDGIEGEGRKESGTFLHYDEEPRKGRK
jgi:FixJ family two-component response regulator/DNA-binding HxlR family transcriptional regulator